MKAQSKFIIQHFVKPGVYEPIDIRTLPVMSASADSVGNVKHWSIKGTMNADGKRAIEQAAGFSSQTLNRHLGFWANASQHGYSDLCLMLEVDDVLYRLTK